MEETNVALVKRWRQPGGLGQKIQVKEGGEMEKNSLGQGKGKGNLQES